ncbi:MAG: PEP-CTERM sorting domain-containing protein [Microcoleaceae cyanobacterium]
MKFLSSKIITTALLAIGVVAAAPAQAFTINFDEGFGGTPGDGTRITDQYYNDFGITFDTNRRHGLLLYDTECVGKNGSSTNGFTNACTGGDEDLATGRGEYKNGRYDYDTEAQGNVLIIQEDGSNTPDDHRNGGLVNLNFATSDTSGNQFYEDGITLDNFLFVDLDEAVISNKKLKFNFEYVDSSRNPFEINKNNYSNFITENLLSTDWDGNALEGDNSLRQYTFNNNGGQFDGIQKVTVNYNGISGAIASFDYSATPGSQASNPVEVPEPVSIGALGLLAAGMLRMKKGSK